MYEVEIEEVDKEKKKVKIQFKGYGHDTDEWLDYDRNNVSFERLEKVYVPDEDALEDKMNISSMASFTVFKEIIANFFLPF